MADEIVLQCEHPLDQRERTRARHVESGNSYNAERCKNCGMIIVGGLPMANAEPHQDDQHLLGAK